MTDRKPPSHACCETPSGRTFQVESIVSVDERGQMVLPKELRARAGIGAGDKLALISWERDGAVCCLSLVKADALGEMARDLLAPMMSELRRD